VTTGGEMVIFDDEEDFKREKLNAGKWAKVIFDIKDFDSRLIDRALIGCAVEQYQWTTYQNLASKSNISETKEAFIRNGFEEEKHLIKIGSLIQPLIRSKSLSETDTIDSLMKQNTVWLETAIITEVAEFAQVEAHQIAKDVLDHLLLDHMTHASIIASAFADEIDVSKIVDGRYHLQEGRPLQDQMAGVKSVVRQYYNRLKVGIETKVRIHTIISLETYILSQYQNFLKLITDERLRELYATICAVEADHVSMLNSLIDPSEPALELAITGELAEIYNHKRSMRLADKKIETPFKDAFGEDLEHLQILADIADDLGIVELINRIPVDIPAPEPSLTIDGYITELIASHG